MRARIGITALLLFAADICSAADVAHDIQRSYLDDGRQVVWSVTDETLMRTPEWRFDGKSPAPLSMSDAYQRAYGWLRKSFPKISNFKLHSYEVRSAASSTVSNRWFYSMNFYGELDGSSVNNAKFSVMVLMDGLVVEPREQSK